MRPIAAALRLALGSVWVLGTAGAAHAQDAVKSEPEHDMPTVVVNASADASADGLARSYAGRQVARGSRAGILGNLDMMSTPFNGTAYTAELIQDQQARSVSDVVQNDPSVRTARGFGNFQELYVVRGFPVFSDDMAYNGLYGLLPRQYVAAEFLERVEVFRGANTFLNGAAPGGSGIGGAINLLPKRAPNQALTQVSAGIESGGQAYYATDLARRFGTGGRAGVRVNAARRDGATAVDREERELDVLALGMDYRGDAFRVSADMGYQNHAIDAPRPSVTPTGAIPAAPDADSSFAQRWTTSGERQRFGTLRGEIDLPGAMTAWIGAGVRNGEEANVLANPRSNANGDTTAYRFDNLRKDRVETAEAGLRGKLVAGGIGHAWVLSVAEFELASRNAYAFSNFAGFAGNLYAPHDVARPPADFFVGGTMAAPHVTERTGTRSAAIADTMSLLADTVLLTVGARQQNIEQATYDYNTGALVSSYDENALTPVAGLVYKPAKQVSLYANYIEGLAKGDVAPNTAGGQPVANAGEALSPYRSKQKEAGIKYDGGRLGASVGVFSTAKPFGMVNDGRFEAAGEQRNRGLEVSLFGEPVRGLRVLGGATFIDARLKKTAGGTFDGKQAIGVPRAQVNAGVEWDIAAVPGLTLTGRVLNTSTQYADAANATQLPSWTRLDLGVRYMTMVGANTLALRARVDNVAGRNYWASTGGYPGANYLVLGAPRTLALTATLDF